MRQAHQAQKLILDAFALAWLQLDVKYGLMQILFEVCVSIVNLCQIHPGLDVVKSPRSSLDLHQVRAVVQHTLCGSSIRLET